MGSRDGECVEKHAHFEKLRFLNIFKKLWEPHLGLRKSKIYDLTSEGRAWIGLRG